MLELLNHIKNVLVLSGLEGARLDSAMFLIEDKLESTTVLSNTVEVKEVEKIVEVEVPVEVEVIPDEVEEELDSLKKSLQEKEAELNDTMNILEATLDDVETLQARCTELHEQNEYLLSQLEQPEEEVAFEEPEQISNEDILANSMTEEIDEEAILNQLEESLEQVAIEEPEKKVNRSSRTSKRKAGSSYDMYGNPRRQRSLRQNNDDTQTFLDYYHKIKSGELNQTNLTPDLITTIHTLACKVNKGEAPTEVAELYFNIMNGDEH